MQFFELWRKSMNFGYVTFLSTDSYLKRVLVLNYSLCQVNSKYHVNCMVTKNISKKSLRILKQMNIKTIKIKSIKISKELRDSVKDKNFEHWNNAWNKLNVFRLTKFDKIIYLDGDTLIRRDILEMYEYPFNDNYGPIRFLPEPDPAHARPYCRHH